MAKPSLLEQYIKLVVEATIPAVPTAAFSLKQLDKFSLSQAKELRQFVASKLGAPIGAGYSRTTFPVNDHSVLKVVGSMDFPFALRQNTNEVHNSECLGREYSPEIYEHDKNFMWIYAERVQPTTPQALRAKFKEITGLELDLYEIVELFADPEGRVNKLHTQLMKKNPWFATLVKKLAGCRIDTNDFKPENWGIRKNGDLVLLDLGLNAH